MDKRMKEETKDTSSIANVIVSDEDAADGRQRSRLDEKFWGSFAHKIGIRLNLEGAAQPRMPASTYTFHLLLQLDLCLTHNSRCAALHRTKMQGWETWGLQVLQHRALSVPITEFDEVSRMVAFHIQMA